MVPKQTSHVEFSKAKTVLRAYLDARWSYSRDSTARTVTQKHITASARRELDDTVFVGGWFRAHELLRGQNFVDARIDALKFISDDTIIGDVTLAIPTQNEFESLVTQRDRAALSNIIYMKEQGIDWTSVDHKKFQNSVLPVRHLVTVRYRVERFGDQWLVNPQWTDPSIEFSERWWLAHNLKRGWTGMTDEDQAAYTLFKSAELDIATFDFERAIANYLTLQERFVTMPKFMESRIASIPRLEKKWNDKLKNLNLSFSLKPSRSVDNSQAISPGVVTDQDGKHFELTVDNKGSRAIAEIRVWIMDASGRTFESTSMTSIAPSATQSVAINWFDSVGPFTFHVHQITFDDGAAGYDFGTYHIIRRRFENWLTDGKFATSTTRLFDLITTVAPQIYECAGWSTQNVFFDVTIGTSGSVERARGLGVDPSFEKCVATQLESLTLGPSIAPWTVRVQLLQPSLMHPEAMGMR